MALIKTAYPVASSIVKVITLAGLATDANLLIGRVSTAADNTVNLDIDHLVSGVITTGTTPTVSTRIEVWAYAPYRTAAGAPTYPDAIPATDAAKTMTSANVKNGALRLVASLIIDATSDRAYTFAPVSIAALFGGMPKFWGLFVVHNTGVALNATAGNHVIEYERIQAQTV